MSWTLPQALELVRELEAHAVVQGWHVGLTGSVLQLGSSEKDVDVIAYPHKKKGRQCPRKGGLHAALIAAGLTLRVPYKKLRKLPPRDGSKRDKKWVEIWQAPDGRRVDVIVLS